jgi:D-3-phosphoglycerate dehydrogenase
MAKILVTEEIAESGLDLLRQGGHEVIVDLTTTPSTLLEAVKGVHALIIRSATKVTREVLEAADSLQVVGRAGIGLDNVDVVVATSRGVMVVNAPQSNILSAAELTMALLLSQARNVPQAHNALVAGRWERSKWEGVELYGKTMGVVGLGRIGALVAQRCLAFGMTLVAYDPYVSQERARKMGVELMTLDEVVAASDFLTIHLPKSKETMGLIDKELLAKAKPGMRIINAARGGIVDETALYDALASGHLGGASLDVFSSEPPTDSPLLSLSNVVVTPHLGASTSEAQDKAGITIAEQLLLAFQGEFVPFAVNVNAGEASGVIKPFLSLTESLGRFIASLNGGLPERLDIEYQGVLADEDTRILTLSALKGIFAAGTNEPVSYVNAPQLAAERGLEITETTTVTPRQHYVALVTLRTPAHSVSGTFIGNSSEPRIVEVDGHGVEVPPSTHMLAVKNDDRPGKIGLVGTVLGEAGISISSMGVSPAETGGTALMILAVGSEVPEEIVEQLGAAEGILYARSVTCFSLS